MTDLSIEELANLQITSVSRRAERLSDAAAAVYVITPEAIRRSGATSLPQALRLAPNLQVAQINANQYAITARGFNNAIGNKLLVLIDGRTVYTPFFSGVFWDQQDVLLEDVERIEVISGPGATLWGSNAVNGVINIITRAASQTQGVLAVAAAGTGEGRLAARYGGTLGERGHFRLYGKRSHLSPTRTENGPEATDRWDMQQAGFRADGSAGADDWTLQGDIYRGVSDVQYFRRVVKLGQLEASGANLLGRWTHRFDGDSSLRLQAYHDRSKRDDPLAYRPQERITDIEAQHALRVGAHQVVWGGGYRQASDDVQPGFVFGFVPTSRTLRWTNLFLQDGIRLADTVDLTLGAKLEHNDYTGTENLPSARLAWKPAPQQLLWGAVSRAVRAPARLDRDIRALPPPQPAYIIAGGPDFVSEVATVLELGWRDQLGAQFSWSVAAHHTRWSRLRSGQPPPNALVQNMIDGSTQGIEAWADWQPLPRWRLSAGLALLNEDLRVMPGSTDPVGPSALGNDPHHQWSLRSSFDLTPTQELDIDVRRVAALPNPQLPAYTAWDLRYGWRPRSDLLLALVGRNLFQPSHAEFGDPGTRSEIARGALLQVTWSY
ncbi:MULTISPECIES: TonB-dependent siderophore receptor [unclassified Rhizobacter]|uniref:TonB-dependent receptor plug domain-containing protein n=1 Tax=unclassified Rhizobacter TaxID=2640088 RepID=UPI00138F778E|nr:MULTISPECIES: TonB-dependent receptor [unclassified Rhizobacter]